MTRVQMLGFWLATSAAVGLLHRHVAWDGLLLGKNGSKIRGVVGMVAGKSAGTTAVDVKYARDVAGATRPWHVQVGSCEKPGPVFGPASAYPLLRVDAKGAVEAKAILRLALPDSGEFYVNIHESSSSMGKIVACSDLLLEE